MRKKIIIVVISILVLAFIAYNYMYKSHRDISTETISYTTSVAEIYNAFQKNDSLANAKYLDKTVEINGKITNIDVTNKIIELLT